MVIHEVDLFLCLVNKKTVVCLNITVCLFKQITVDINMIWIAQRNIHQYLSLL